MTELTARTAAAALAAAVADHVGPDRPSAAVRCFDDEAFGAIGTVLFDTARDSEAGWDPDESTEISSGLRFADCVQALSPVAGAHFEVYADGRVLDADGIDVDLP